ncbi:restriction endonuclease subunit S [Streptomyces sp. NPDC020571]|uniref:restriction endonuclease subunit S n=1 Tax=Streptomyces sp. NPDC020571 TaxID=3365079 RepID=UPI00379B1DEE
MSWSTLPVRRIFRVVNGGTPTADESNWGGDVPWATPVDIGAAGACLSATQRTLTMAGAVGGSRIVPEGSILLSTRAPIGYVTQTAVPMAFNQGCRALISTRALDVRFFVYQLGAMESQLQAKGQGTTFLELSSEALAAMVVTVPPLDEQRRIADFLDAETARIDLLLGKRRRMGDLLTLRRERITEQVLGLEEGHSTPLVPLKYLVHEVSVGIVVTPAKWYVDDGGVPALRGLNVQPGRILPENLVYISNSGHAENLKSRLKAGDVVVVRTGQAGAAAVVPRELDGVNCIDLIIVRPGKKVDPSYVTYVLNSDYAKGQVGLNSVGSIQAHFNVGAMKQLPIPAVSRSEQAAKVAILDREIGSMNALSERLAAQDRLLKERRQALITAAVTGQLDVTTARPAHDRDL